RPRPRSAPARLGPFLGRAERPAEGEAALRTSDRLRRRRRPGSRAPPRSRRVGLKPEARGLFCGTSPPMATIHLKTEIPGPRSLALWERRKAAVARGLTTLHPVFLERGEGAAVTDVDGNRLLDFTGGIGALNVGHARPEIAKAVSDQVARLTHTAIQVTGYEPYVALAEKLCAIAPINGPRKAFLVTTGTEAVENAVKLSRVASGRSAVVCFEHAFHGRSLGALSFTSRARPYKFGMGPFLPEVYRLPYPTFY